jgi:hypothetical protein
VTSEGLWTVDEAAQWFTAQGIPIRAAQLRLHIKALEWPPAGEGPSGPEGGRGRYMYPITHLMELHKMHTELTGLATHRGGS